MKTLPHLHLPALALAAFASSAIALVPNVSAVHADDTPGVATAAGATVAVDTDWSNPGAVAPLTGNPNVSGSLPAPWQDNSEWSPTRIDYQTLREGTRGFLRMEVTHVEGGWGQMRFFPATAPEGTSYILDVTARDTGNSGVTLGLRMVDAPYKYYWQTNETFGPTWRDTTYYFKAPHLDAPATFVIAPQGTGRFDLAHIRLVSATTEQLAAIVKAHNPQGEAPNLLGHTRFPLGLQAGDGFFIDQNAGSGQRDDEVTAQADAATPGPSGAPALHVHGPQNFELQFAPFALPLFTTPHVASCYLKGDAHGSVAVTGDGKRVGSRAFVVSAADGWKRVQLPFTPGSYARTFILLLDGGKGSDFWIDGLQVETGRAATDYRSQLGAEVALAVDERANIQFTDEPATIKWAVTGAPTGAVLRSRLVDLYGDLPAPAAVVLRQTGTQTGVLTYVPAAGHPMGAFRLEAWVEDDAGTRISPYNEVVVYRLRRPRYWMRPAPNSEFGSHLLSISHDILMAKAIGLNWTRLHDAGMQYTGWYHLEPQKGQWIFRDAELQRYAKYGMKIMGELAQTPRWASNFEKPHDSYFDQFYLPRSQDDFANYVRTLTTRYHGLIDTYEVWNEPWNHGWLNVGYKESGGGEARANYIYSPNPVADYAQLMKTAYTTAKAVDPALTIVGFNTTTGSHDYPTSLAGDHWTSGILASGGLDNCDAISYHYYPNGPDGFAGDGAETGYATAIGPILQKFGHAPKPVVMSEGGGGFGLPLGLGFYHYTIPYDNHEPLVTAADDLCRYTTSVLSRGVSRLFLYTMHGREYLGGPMQWSLLINGDGSLHPSGVAFSNLTWRLEDTHFARRVELVPGVYAFLFEGDGRAEAVLARKPASATAFAMRASPGVTYDDLWGNPVAPGTQLGDSVAYAELTGPGAMAQALEAALKATQIAQG